MTKGPRSLTKKIAIAGITGKLGRLIAKHLLARDYVEVHGIARNPDRLPDNIKSNPKLKLFRSDMKEAVSMREAVRGCSLVISVILSDPTSEILMQKAMIDVCIEEGVPRFMPNEFTIDWRAVDLDLLPMKKANKEIFEYLHARQDKIKSVHVLIGGFMETMFSVGYWYHPNKSPIEGLSSWGDGDDVWEVTSYDNAAQYAAAVAMNDEATGYLRFLGDRVSIKEVAQTLQYVYDTSPVPFTSRGSLQDLKEQGRQGIKKNPESDDFWEWQGQSYSLFLMNGQAYLEAPLDNNKYMEEVQQETLEAWLQDRNIQELSKSVWF